MSLQIWPLISFVNLIIYVLVSARSAYFCCKEGIFLFDLQFRQIIIFIVDCFFY